MISLSVRLETGGNCHCSLALSEAQQRPTNTSKLTNQQAVSHSFNLYTKGNVKTAICDFRGRYVVNS